MRQVVSDLCCECGNCLQACPRNAIALRRDAGGNCHAVMDPKLCIDCHLCTLSCPMQNPALRAVPVEAFGAISRSPDAAYSTSGGIFFELASAVLQSNGLVSGAAYCNDWSVSHILIKNQSELIKLQGSKYVKSDMEPVFPKIKDALQQGKTVLFSGTPCQVAALQRFVRDPDLLDRLIGVDIICHGTPPAFLFRDFIAALEAKYHGRLCNFTFRDKSFGNKHCGSFTIQKGGSERRHPLYSGENPYYYLFLKGLICTECCYSCPYAAAERSGDITIGDFWGWQQEIPDFAQRYDLPNDSSVSAVMVNTEKGKRLFQQIQPKLISCSVSYEQIRRSNLQLRTPVQVDSNVRKHIWDAYMQNGYPGLVKIYREMTDIRRYLARIADHIPCSIKANLKKVLRR